MKAAVILYVVLFIATFVGMVSGVPSYLPRARDLSSAMKTSYLKEDPSCCDKPPYHCFCCTAICR